MAADDKAGSFWVTLPGILTGVAAVLTAVTGLLVILNQAGIIGNHDETFQGSERSGATAAESTGSGAGGDVSALVGTWRGRAANPDGSNAFIVVLTVEETCRLNQACGTISVSSGPCKGRVQLVGVRSGVYEFSVDRFTADSGSGCTPGAGEFFEPLDDGTLRYTTDYGDHAGGVLREVG